MLATLLPSHLGQVIVLEPGSLLTPCLSAAVWNPATLASEHCKNQRFAFPVHAVDPAVDIPSTSDFISSGIDDVVVDRNVT